MSNDNLLVQRNRKLLRQINPRKRKKIQLNWVWHILFVLGICMFITATTFYIQPGSIKEVGKLILQQPLILIVNFLPVLLMVGILHFLINNLFYSAAITSFIFNVCSLINRIKIEIRDDPFVPRDVQLIQEALNSVTDFKVKINVSVLLLILAAVIMFLVANYIFEAKRFSASRRIIGGVIVLVSIFMANKFIYSSNVVYYKKLHVSNRSYVPRVFRELGFTYCFLYNLNVKLVQKPDNFSKHEVEELIKTYSSTEKVVPETKPHIIFIMNEAFSDIGLDQAFDYNSENTPYKYWNEIVQEPNTISGHLIVPGFGGGTANTEFDIMTGMQTNMLNSVATSAFRAVGKNTQSIARILKKDGYYSLFMHPGDSWFYNRNSVYKYFGMDDTIFKDTFTSDEKKGNMIGDEALTQHMKDVFNEHISDNAGQPLFWYVTSIQNHMPYTVRKYGDLEIEEAKLKKQVSQEAKDFVSVYMEGIRDANLMLKNLTDYFRAMDEPVILVFYGDHLPNLGDNYLSYREIGLNVGNEASEQDILNTYSTPYVIWANDKAASAINLKQKKDELQLPEDNTINANYLGAMMLELLGYSGQDPYIDFINEVRREVPVAFKGNYKTVDDGLTTELDEYDQTMVDNMKNWEYYKMKYEKVNN